MHDNSELHHHIYIKIVLTLLLGNGMPARTAYLAIPEVYNPLDLLQYECSMF